ncbi:MAG TPA: START domain-containing protein, partial [Cyclobacteriaceae bacterium]|nr:START domain-containing protein [Cyclobacteriaceae bacterium]
NAQENCKLKKDKDGIKVYTCDEEDSKFKSLRAEFSLERITKDQLKSFLLDGDNYLTWQYKMIESKVLQPLGDDEVIVRSVLDAPWPVTNREMIVKVSIVDKTGGLTVTTSSIGYTYPMSDDLVRVPFSQAIWEIAPVDKGLSVRYFLRINPGGSIPTWLVNMAMAEGPYETFRNLRKQFVK